MQDAVKVMKREGAKGAIVNIISMSSHGGQPFITAYSASKGALLTLTRNVGFQLMRHGIRCNGLNIGWTDHAGRGPHPEDLPRCPTRAGRQRRRGLCRSGG